MYSVVLMMAMSGGADAVECRGHNGGCVSVAPVACCTPVVVAPASCGGCVGGNGCEGGRGGLFRGGLFHRNRNNGCCGAVAAPVCCPTPAPAPCPAPCPAPVADCGCVGGHGGHARVRGGLFHRNNGCVGAVACPGCH